jgi:hypothetical protein
MEGPQDSTKVLQLGREREITSTINAHYNRIALETLPQLSQAGRH